MEWHVIRTEKKNWRTYAHLILGSRNWFQVPRKREPLTLKIKALRNNCSSWTSCWSDKLESEVRENAEKLWRHARHCTLSREQSLEKNTAELIDTLYIQEIIEDNYNFIRNLQSLFQFSPVSSSREQHDAQSKICSINHHCTSFFSRKAERQFIKHSIESSL